MSAAEQVQRWREATGRHTPARVPLRASVDVGRFHFETTGETFPPVLRMLEGKAKGPRSRGKRPVQFAALGPSGDRGGFRGRAKRPKGAEADWQRDAYTAALESGRWAP